MSIVLSVVLIVQVLSAIGLIVLVLLQHGKGADMGAAFGSGASGSLFGATGSANFLSRATAALATVFFVCTLALAFLSNRRIEAPASVMEQPAAAGAKSSPPAGMAPGAGMTPSATPAAGAGQGAQPTQGPQVGQGNDIPK